MTSQKNTKAGMIGKGLHARDIILYIIYVGLATSTTGIVGTAGMKKPPEAWIVKPQAWGVEISSRVCVIPVGRTRSVPVLQKCSVERQRRAGIEWCPVGSSGIIGRTTNEQVTACKRCMNQVPANLNNQKSLRSRSGRRLLETLNFWVTLQGIVRSVGPLVGLSYQSDKALKDLGCQTIHPLWI